jgi:O-antigen/teichoic acid export membrane protein
MVIDAARDTVIRQRVLRSTVSNYLGKLITLCTWFFLTPFILRRLGPTAYGLWALVGSLVTYGSLLDLGVGRAVIKYVAEYNARGETKQAHSLVATALCLYSVLSLIAILVSAIIAPVFPGFFNLPPEERATATWLVLLMGSGIGISIPCTTTTAVLRGLQRYDILNLIAIIGTLLSAVATITILFLGGGVLGMVGVSIAVMLVMQAPSIWFINRIAPELRFGWRGAKRSLVRTILSFSSSLFVIDMATRLQTKTDETVIGAFLQVSFVTPYSLARRLSEVPQILTDQFMKVLLPLASQLHAENDRARLRLLYITGTRLTLAIFLPIGCTVVILARPILTAWVGPEYGNYPHLVAILAFASLINTSQWPASSVLQSMARHQLLAVTSLGSGLANLALSIVLVGRFGLTGVALGTLIPTAAECLGLVLPYALRVIGVSKTQILKDVFLPALLPAIPTAIVLYVLRHTFEPSSLLSIMVVAGIGLLVYVIGYLSVGASEVERQTCRSFVLSTVRFAEARLKRA